MIFPQRRSYTELAGLEKMVTADGAELAYRYVEGAGAEKVILYFHGNNEDLGTIKGFMDEAAGRGYSIIAWDYRGYGVSTGRPSEENVFADSRLIYRYLLDDKGFKAGDVILYGYSLGSGPATDLAVEMPVAGLILEGGFVSAFQVVLNHLHLPFDKFLNEQKIANVNCPVLIMHGKKDKLVKFDHGQRMYDKAAEPKRCFWVDEGEHSTLRSVAGEEYWEVLDSFADSLD